MNDGPRIQNEIIAARCQAFYGKAPKTRQKICTHACCYFLFFIPERSQITDPSGGYRQILEEPRVNAHRQPPG